MGLRQLLPPGTRVYYRFESECFGGTVIDNTLSRLKKFDWLVGLNRDVILVRWDRNLNVNWANLDSLFIEGTDQPATTYNQSTEDKLWD